MGRPFFPGAEDFSFITILLFLIKSATVKLKVYLSAKLHVNHLKLQ